MLNWEKTPAATLISQRRSPPLTNATSSPSPMLASVPVTVGDLTQSQVAKKWACLGSAMSGAKRRVTSCARPGTATVASNASTSKTGFTEQVYEATQERRASLADSRSDLQLRRRLPFREWTAHD